MKINWGTGIVIGMVLFMLFILQYVLRVQLDPKLDNELVTESYYQKEQEINYNREKLENAYELGNELQITTSVQGIEILFPLHFNPDEIKGTISLYRPSNQKFDQTIHLDLQSNFLLIPRSKLVDGSWNITIDFVYNNKGYLKTQTLNL